MVGFDQQSPHHAYDLYTHTAKVTEGVGDDLVLRWAALLHDTGKVTTFTTDAAGRGHFYGHGKASAEIADQVLRRLKAPTALREQVVLLIEHHMTRLEPDKKVLRRWISRLGLEPVEQLLQLQRGDMASKGVEEPGETDYFGQVSDILQQIKEENACLSLRDLAVNGRDLMALGITGRDIGQWLQKLLDLVLEEQLPNDAEALLAYVKKNRL